MADSRPGAEKVKLVSKTPCEQERELLKINWVLSKDTRVRLKVPLLLVKLLTNEHQKEQCSYFKYIESMKTHKSKKRKPEKTHLAPFRAALKPTPSFESWRFKEELSIYPGK